jgi:hypothetical protein
MFTVKTDNAGTIWISHPEPFEKDRNRVANISRDDRADVWRIEISKGTCTLDFNLVISPVNTQDKIIQIVKDMMMFTSCGVFFQ